jgi:acetate kinase
MHVLVVNAGSSSLKHALVDAAGEVVLARGEQRWEPGAGAGRHADALRAALAVGSLAGGGADAVGHRVVHGGTCFDGPVCIDAGVRDAIASLEPLAPLHTPPFTARSRPRPRPTRCRASGASASACAASAFTG